MIDGEQEHAPAPSRQSSLLDMKSLTNPSSSRASVADSAGGGRFVRSARKRFKLLDEPEQEPAKLPTEQDIKQLQDRIVLLEN